MGTGGSPAELRDSSGAGDSERPRFRSGVAGGLRRLSSLLVPTRRSRASAARPGSAGVRRSCLHSGESLALPTRLPSALPSPFFPVRSDPVFPASLPLCLQFFARLQSPHHPRKPDQRHDLHSAQWPHQDRLWCWRGGAGQGAGVGNLREPGTETAQSPGPTDALSFSLRRPLQCGTASSPMVCGVSGVWGPWRNWSAQHHTFS